jgi:proton-dependent oligopeptide transporter, POT family
MADVKEPFPRSFYIANAVELFERLAHYGFYINLTLFLRDVVGMNAIAIGWLIGNFRLIGSLAPIPCGAIADKISFKRSLMIAFTGYALAYGAILVSPTRAAVIPALFLAAFSGGFMKPVILGIVARTSPPGREADGYGVFYRMVNSGSVVGKTLAYIVRYFGAIRFVLANSMVASLISLGIATFLFEEPKVVKQEKKQGPAFVELMRGYWDALKNLRFTAFLVIFAGYYFMAEQFYMTFPTYVTLHIDKKAPLEIITLINPAMIALFQGRFARWTAHIKPATSMMLGVLIGAVAMLVMGAVPTIAGTCLSGAIFACAEMVFSPRFYAYIQSFAPKGKEGMYGGLTFVPSAIGAWVGGFVSGNLIYVFLPIAGKREPLAIWSSYAALGLVCSLAMIAYAKITGRASQEPANRPARTT